MSRKNVDVDLSAVELPPEAEPAKLHVASSARQAGPVPGPDSLTRPRFRQVRSVSVPTLSLQVGVPAFVKFLTEFAQDLREPGGDESPDQSMRPPHVCRVMAYEDSGEEVGERSLVGGTVLVHTMLENYPDGAYVGRLFQITKVARPRKDGTDRVRAGGRADYYLYIVTEIVLED